MNFDLIKEVQDEAQCKKESYKRKVAKYYNKRAKNRQFQAKNLVLHRIKAADYILRKLDLIWEGPFRVTKVASAKAYWLEKMDSKPLPHSWTIDNLRKFYYEMKSLSSF